MRNQAVGLDLHNQLVNAGPGSKQMMKTAKRIETALQRLPRFYLLTHILAPSLGRAFEVDVRLTAQIRSARAALAAERYRLDNGRFPEQLDQLAGDYLDRVPIDPFDDKPLRYRLDDDALIIYSVGRNQIDDGGDVRRDKKARRAQRDWGFILLAPEYRGLPAPEEDAPATRPGVSPPFSCEKR